MDIIYMIDGLTAEQKVSVYQIFFEEMKNLHVGQGLDLYWHNLNDTDLLTKDKYLYMASQKTGGLLRLGVRILGVVNNWNVELVEIFSDYVNKLGVAFQIIDDALNLEENEVSKKSHII